MVEKMGYVFGCSFFSPERFGSWLELENLNKQELGSLIKQENGNYVVMTESLQTPTGPSLCIQVDSKMHCESAKLTGLNANDVLILAYLSACAVAAPINE